MTVWIQVHAGAHWWTSHGPGGAVVGGSWDEVVVDPTRGFGQPIFARGGARLEAAVRIATRVAA